MVLWILWYLWIIRDNFLFGLRHCHWSEMRNCYKMLESSEVLYLVGNLVITSIIHLFMYVFIYCVCACVCQVNISNKGGGGGGGGTCPLLGRRIFLIYIYDDIQYNQNGNYDKSDHIITWSNTVRLLHNMTDYFLQNTHKWHSIACPWGQAMECPLWVHSIIYILHSWLSLYILLYSNITLW